MHHKLCIVEEDSDQIHLMQIHTCANFSLLEHPFFSHSIISFCNSMLFDWRDINQKMVKLIRSSRLEGMLG